MLITCRYWCLKEAFVKAIGVGVGKRLDNVEFHHSDWNDIFVIVDGTEFNNWRFWLLEMGENHLVSMQALIVFAFLFL
mgnify:CR=1 FL=1